VIPQRLPGGLFHLETTEAQLGNAEEESDVHGAQFKRFPSLAAPPKACRKTVERKYLVKNSKDFSGLYVQ
jgi:hypothetical protein